MLLSLHTGLAVMTELLYEGRMILCMHVTRFKASELHI